MKVPVVAVLAWCGLLAAQGLAMGQQSGNQIHRMKDDGPHPPADALSAEACRGFVILPNGYAVLSGIRDEVDQAGETHTQHGSAPATAKAHMTHNQGGQDKSATPMARDHLMGLRHGDNIKSGSKWLCVPLDEIAATQWTAASPTPALNLKAKSLRGALAHNSRSNEGFEITIADGSKPIGNADVRMVARMPHHDRNMPGGHGPANDPDALGMTMKAAGKGRYLLNNVDFNMGGAWLFEVQIKRNSATSKAYFAAQVGQE